MFYINLRIMENIAEEMQIQLRSLIREIACVENVLYDLSRMSGMDHMEKALKRELTNMEAQQKTLFLLFTVLQMSLRYYRKCENGNMDFADNYKPRRRDLVWYEVGSNEIAAAGLGQIIF